jgi:hypothetical protein
MSMANDLLNIFGSRRRKSVKDERAGRHPVSTHRQGRAYENVR